MSERYKTITFDDFSGGEQCDMIKPPAGSFKSSENLVIQSNKIKLGKKLKGGVLYDSGLDDPTSDGKKLSFRYGAYVYVLATDGVDCFIKRCLMTDGSWTAVKTLPDSGDEVHCFIKFRGKAIANYFDDAGAVYLTKYASISAMAGAWADTNLVALSGINSFIIEDYVIIHDRLYILGSDLKIYYSDDGITFALLTTLDSFYDYTSLEYLAGYLYVVNTAYNSVGGLVRISLSGEIQDEVVSVGQNSDFSHRVFAGNSYILIDRRSLYRVEGTDLILVFKFENAVQFIPSSEFVNLLFFWDSSDNVIIEMNIDEKMSRSLYVLAAVSTASFLHKYGNYIFCVCASAGNTKVALYSDDYIVSGNIQTRLAKLKSQGVPKQLVLRHRSLTANAWVKVYVKVDQAAAWGSAVITSNAINAVKKVYDFPAGTELDFIEFKIEYGTDDSSETPEDATLDFIYLPTGLANSK